MRSHGLAVPPLLSFFLEQSDSGLLARRSLLSLSPSTSSLFQRPLSRHIHIRYSPPSLTNSSPTHAEVIAVSEIVDCAGRLQQGWVRDVLPPQQRRANSTNPTLPTTTQTQTSSTISTQRATTNQSEERRPDRIMGSSLPSAMMPQSTLLPTRDLALLLQGFNNCSLVTVS